MTEFEKGVEYALQFVADNLRIMTHDPKMQAAISIIQDMDNQGYAIPRIVDYMNKTEIKTAHNHGWQYSTVQNILKNLRKNDEIVEDIAEYLKIEGYPLKKRFQYDK